MVGGGVVLSGEHSVSAEVPDPARETLGGANSGRALLRALRDYQAARARGGPIGWLSAKWAVLRHRFWSYALGADIPLQCQLGVGLILPHPNGVVIHPDAVVGPNCLLFQQVTIGTNGGSAPRLGGHVDVGAGAKILGAISIGDHARIGANAVVLRDVPAGATAVGIPARIIFGAQPPSAD